MRYRIKNKVANRKVLKMLLSVLNTFKTIVFRYLTVRVRNPLIASLVTHVSNTSQTTSFRIFNTRIIFSILIIATLLFACEPWDESADVSHISYIPTFELEGGQYLSYVKNELDTFIDPGAKAYENDQELKVRVVGDTAVHPDEVGLYIIAYYTFNSDDLLGVDYRYVSITHEAVSLHDLTGDYTGTNWSPLTEMYVTKINEVGYYKCSEVMGFPGAEMKGAFVDLGKGDLVLLPGEGFFGGYTASEGRYTLSTLAWTINLTDEPNDGVAVDVIWSKQE